MKNDHVCGTPDAMCDTECMEAAARAVVQLLFDREAFDALKTLLGTKSFNNTGREESVSHRIEREALKRIFDQIRDLNYSDV